MTEEKDELELERPVNWFVGNFICLIDWFYFLFLPSQFWVVTGKFVFLIWLNVWFYFTARGLTIWQLLDIYWTAMASCFSAVFSYIWSFAIMKYISGVMSDNWLSEFVFSAIHIVFPVFLSLSPYHTKYHDINCSLWLLKTVSVSDSFTSTI